MILSSSSTFSLKQLYEKVTTVIENKFTLFHGLTLTNISIDKQLSINDKYQSSFYIGTTKTSNKDYAVQLKISNYIIMNHLKQNGTQQYNAKYDLEIDSLNVSSFGMITITVKSIKETGVSERELLRRRLERFTRVHKYDKRIKKELPRLVTSILALTSKFSNINDDLHSNLNINKERVTVVNCINSNEISYQIKNNKKYDIVVLYRGGREDEAMNMFSSESIIEAIVSSRVPVCTALGHDMDTPFIYAIADKTYSTPSAFSKAIAMHNIRVKEEYLTILNNIANTLDILKKSIFNHSLKVFDYIEAISQRLYEKVNAKIDKLLKDIENTTKRISDRVIYSISTKSKNIEDLVLQIYKLKIDNLSTMETAIEYHLQDAYKNRINFIDAQLTKVEQYGLRLEEHISSNQRLELEKKKKQKTLQVFITIVIVLLAIIIWLTF